MKRRISVVSIMIASVFLAACAPTTAGKVYQVGNVLAELGNATAAVCEQQRLTRPQCEQASIAYDQAQATWRLARAFADQGQDGRAMRKLSGVVGFILTTSATLTEANVALPGNVLEYINLIAGGLK